MKVFVINLDERPEKWETLKSRPEFSCFEFIRVSAKTGNGLTSEKNNLTKGQIGCFISHKALWQKCITENLPWICIAEDDIYPPKGYSSPASTLSKVIEEENLSKWDILYLSRCEDMRDALSVGKVSYGLSFLEEEVKNIDFLPKRVTITPPRMGLHFYIATQDGCRKLLNACEKIMAPVDVQIWFGFEKLRAFRLENSSLVLENLSVSDTSDLGLWKRFQSLLTMTPEKYNPVSTLSSEERNVLQKLFNLAPTQAFELLENSFQKESYKYLWCQSLLFQRLKITDEAISLISKAISLQPNDSEFYHSAGMFFLNERMEQDALISFWTGLKSCTTNSQLEKLLQIGLLKVLLRDKVHTQKVLDYAETVIMPQFEGCIELMELMWQTYESLKKYAQAIKYVRMCMNFLPDEHRLKYNLGVMILHAIKEKRPLDPHNTLEKGLEYIHECLVLMPSFVQAYLTLARYYSHQNDFESAYQVMKECLQQSPSAIQAPEVQLLVATVGLDYGDFQLTNSMLMGLSKVLHIRSSDLQNSTPKFKQMISEYMLELHRYYKMTKQWELSRKTIDELIESSSLVTKSLKNIRHYHMCRSCLDLLLDGDNPNSYQYNPFEVMGLEDIVCRHYQVHPWKGEQIDSLVIVSVGGFGDLFMFLRYVCFILERQMVNFVYLVWDDRVNKLIDYIPFISDFIAKDRLLVLSDLAFMNLLLELPRSPTHIIDVMALPWICMPYIQSNPKVIESKYMEVTNPQPLSFFTDRQIVSENTYFFKWQSSKQNSMRRWRDIPLHYFENLFRIPNTFWITIDKDLDDDDIKLLDKYSNVIVLKNMDNDAFYDTCQVLTQVNSVVTVDTSIVHLAGTLGVKCHLLLCAVPEWRWGISGNKTKWYSNVTIWRQKDFDDWTVPMNRLRNELQTNDVTSEISIYAPISYGELLDKLSILQLKEDNLISSAGKEEPLGKVRDEKNILNRIREKYREQETPNVITAYTQLCQANASLWNLEDELRQLMEIEETGTRFIEVAMEIPRENGRRAEAKRKINTLMNSALTEIKLYL
jgi:GR25 family glycosyltransferase involved in LPS biosynthesis